MTSFQRVNGVVLRYGLSGPVTGPVLVLANSLGTDARIWESVTERLSDKFRVLSYDKRGHGLSDAPPGEYSLADHVADLLALVDRLGIARFALAGVSVGGLIAQGFAVQNPDRLTALVLCNTAAKIGTPEMWNARIEMVVGQGIAAVSDTILERWFSPQFREAYPDEVTGWRSLLERSPAIGYVGTCATLRDADLRHEVGGIDVPTLVTGGQQDLSTPPDLVRATAAGIPGARFELLDPCGHIPSIEQPEKLAELIRYFLSEARHA